MRGGCTHNMHGHSWGRGRGAITRFRGEGVAGAMLVWDHGCSCCSVFVALSQRIRPHSSLALRFLCCHGVVLRDIRFKHFVEGAGVNACDDSGSGSGRIHPRHKTRNYRLVGRLQRLIIFLELAL